MDKYFRKATRPTASRVRLRRGADAGAGAEAVRRQSHARERHEAGGQPEEFSNRPMLLPGIKINTSPTDFFPIEQMQAASIMVLPVLIYWCLLDAGIGAAIVALRLVLLSTAGIIVNYASAAGVWAICCGFDPGRRGFSSRRTPGVRTSTAGAGGQSSSPAARTYVCDGKVVHCARLPARSCDDHQPGSSASRPAHLSSEDRQGKQLPHS
jgi:hypothetical protein